MAGSIIPSGSAGSVRVPWWGAPADWPPPPIEVGMLVRVGAIGGSTWAGDVALVVAVRESRSGGRALVIGAKGSIELSVLVLRPV